MKSQRILKDQYKARKSKIGVFQIKNTINGKIYVDGSLDLDAIWNRNKMELKFGSHRNEILQQEWRAFGEENFMFEILAEIEQKEGVEMNYAYELKQLTSMFIEELSPFLDKGYNNR